MYEYTADELEIHYEALLRRRSKETRHWGLAMRVAQHAGKRGWSKYMKGLDNLWKDIEMAAGRAPIPAGRFFNALENVGRKTDGND